MKRLFYFYILMSALLAACSDDDSFSSSRSYTLSFSADTVLLDTVFSTVPSATYSFWVHNNNGDGVRLKQVRLERGNQSGYRVNVDGTFLSPTVGYQVSDLELRKGDSLLVFVELTAPETHADEPVRVDDHVVFLLESGVEQRVPLRCYVWDATMLRNLHVSRDTVIESSRPVVVYGGLTVDSAATLTIRNTQLYFHADAGLDVYGRLKTEGCLLRGDRLDHMFDYLPYDRVSGQWKGVHLYASSDRNVLKDTEIRSGQYGVLCDSARLDSTSYRLEMERCVVHNCKGAGVEAYNTHLLLNGCQLTNTLGDCLAVYGGMADITFCTLAQFYPFSADRGAALRFIGSNHYPLARLVCVNSLLTGYEDDVIMGEQTDSTALFRYYFGYDILRTPEVADDTLSFQHIVWETPKDSVQGKQHFVLIDEDNLAYDFRLDSISTARHAAYEGADAGCYQYEVSE